MNDESQRPMNRGANYGSNYVPRKQMMSKYNDSKGGQYSPSSNYNYSQNGQNRGANPNYQQPMHKQRYDRTNNNNRRDFNYTLLEKLTRQNDIMIRLLKEIRDRLSSEGTPADQSSDFITDESLNDEFSGENPEVGQPCDTPVQPQEQNSEPVCDSGVEQNGENQ
ncbi:MAG: hypothetical protein JW795_03280 [Chitinivibrionales bacterium]|nr:hypothetical protein [Chitinivibrionales bacterium]